MLNDLMVISNTAQLDPRLLFWSCVLSKKVVMPLYKRDFELWLYVQREHGGVDIKSIRKWMFPIDEFSPIAWDDNSLIDRRAFLEAYDRNASWNIFFDRQVVYSCMTAMLRVVARESAAVCITAGEFDFISEFMTIGNSSAHAFGAQSAMSILMPDVPDLTFRHIEAIRKSAFIANYAEYVNKAVAAGKTDEAKMRDLISKDFFGLLTDVRPRTVFATVKGIFSSLPLPILVNPVGLLTTVDDVGKSYRLKRDYGWLFFLSDLHRISTERVKSGDTQL